MSTPDTIDDYLDELALRLNGRTRDLRRILLEVEDHLRDAVAAGATEAAAIEAFGAPGTVARRFTGDTPGLVLSLVSTTWHLVAIGLVAIGLSGVLSLGARATMGASFIAGDPVGVTYTSARCADLHEYHPELRSCAATASAHHADEVAVDRMAAGALGVVLFGVWWLALRRRGSVVPREVEGLVAACAFGLAAAALYGLTLLALAEGLHHGAGQWLTAAVVATVFALVSARRATPLLVQERTPSGVTSSA